MKIYASNRSRTGNILRTLGGVALLGGVLLALGCSGGSGDGGTTDTATDATDPDVVEPDVTEGCKTDAECVDPLADLGPCMNQTCNVDSGECETTALENGTECGTGDECVGASTCTDSECIPPDTAVDCDDNNACTTDTCDPATGCVNTPMDECCTEDSVCDDQDVCTTDVCLDNACSSTAIDGCCANDDECDDQDDCTSNSCQENMCSFTAIADCCTDDKECDDLNECTADWCADNVCENAEIIGCGTGCQNNAECDDGDPCTYDNCDAGGCLSSPIVGCCTEKGQCDDNNSCTDDACENNLCLFTENGTCVGPTEDTIVFCTLSGPAGSEATCEVHVAAGSNAVVDQMVAFEIDVSFPASKAEMTGLSCPPGNCAGLNGTLASTHFLQAANKGPGKFKILSFSLPIMPLNGATFISGQLTGETYVFTMHFTLTTGEEVPVIADNFLGSNSGASALPVEFVHFDPSLDYGIVVSGFQPIP